METSRGRAKSIMKQTNVILIIYTPVFFFCFVLSVFSLTHEIYKEHTFITSLSQNGTFHLRKMINIMVKRLCVRKGSAFPKFRGSNVWNPKATLSKVLLEEHPTVYLSYCRNSGIEEVVSFLSHSSAWVWSASHIPSWNVLKQTARDPHF